MMGTTGMCIPYGPCMTGIPPPIIGGGGPPYPPCICCWYIGDSPIVGAGTYADNATCAVSGTGQGEFFVRSVVGHDIAARMAYAGQSLTDAANATMASVAELGGSGGLIAIDRTGTVATPFNTPGMHRGWRLSSSEAVIALFGDEARG